MGFKLILGFVAVAAASAAARFALARMSRHVEKQADQEDEMEDKNGQTISTQEYSKRRETMTSSAGNLRNRWSSTSSITSVDSSFSRKVERVSSTVYTEYLADEDLMATAAQFTNEDLSPSDNAAAMLHLLISEQSNLGISAQAALAYSIKVLKSTTSASALPAALKMEDESKSKSMSKWARARFNLSFKLKTSGLAVVAAQRMAKGGSFLEELESAKGSGSHSKAVSVGGERGEDDRFESPEKKEKKVVYNWLRQEYSTPEIACTSERLRSEHSSPDLALDREPSTELAQEPLPLQPLALHVTLSALAARKLSGEQDSADSQRTSSNTSGGETPGKFESPCNTLPLQTRSCASPDAKRHRGSSSVSSDKEAIGSGSSDKAPIGLSSDKEGSSDALLLHAQVEEQQQQQQKCRPRGDGPLSRSLHCLFSPSEGLDDSGVSGSSSGLGVGALDGIRCYSPHRQEEAAILAALEGVDTLDFDVFKLHEASNGHSLQVIGYHVLAHWGLIEKFHLNKDKVALWLAYIESLYCDTPYHNKIHATDVTQTCHAVLATGGLRAFLTDVETLTMLLAAIVHDVGHDGMNNAYHKKSGSLRAITFNDQSIQENYHLGVFFESLRTDERINIFSGLHRQLVTDIRELMIHMVLHTDMSGHFVALKEFKSLAEEKRESAELWKANTLTLMSIALHACDISAQAKKQALALQWSQRCLEEFFIQGDTEKRYGLPVSPLCDRDCTPVGASQVGFIKFIVLPTYQTLVLVLPALGTCVEQLYSNMAFWEAHSDYCF